MNKIIYVWLALKTVLCTCEPDQKTNNFKKAGSHYSISKTGMLAPIAKESSGVAIKSKDSFWTINDSGGKAELYEMSWAGKLLSTRQVPGSANQDWEDLAQSEDGSVFIGDFGNNSSSRRSLNIYKLSEGVSEVEKITFSYAGQTQFPPQGKSNMNYDCEAFFYQKNNLYLFSKNWSSTNKYVKLYKLPATKGNYKIAPVDSIRLNSMVTSADISPDGKTFALLTYGKLLLFDVKNDVINFKSPRECIRVSKKQTEAVAFLNGNDLLVTNEQGGIFWITYQ